MSFALCLVPYMQVALYICIFCIYIYIYVSLAKVMETYVCPICICHIYMPYMSFGIHMQTTYEKEI